MKNHAIIFLLLALVVAEQAEARSCASNPNVPSLMVDYIVGMANTWEDTGACDTETPSGCGIKRLFTMPADGKACALCHANKTDTAPRLLLIDHRQATEIDHGQRHVDRWQHFLHWNVLDDAERRAQRRMAASQFGQRLRDDVARACTAESNHVRRVTAE